MPRLMTTLGPRVAADLGWILPHEHVFVDLRTEREPGYGEADAADVVTLMTPQIEAARAQGITAIVEPSGLGVGRRADILRAVSAATGFPLVVPTGAYREPWLPRRIREMPVDAIADLFTRELTVGINDTGVVAGWIKIAATDEGMTDAERRVLHAAVAASRRTGATIGSHSLRGAVATDQVTEIERLGGDPSRFVWIHAQHEPDTAIHRELAARGIWIEYDTIGDPGKDDWFAALIHGIIDAGFGDQLLISQDRGWYDPAKPGGGTPRPYTYLVDTFLPVSGLDTPTIDLLLRHNPFRAFAR